MVGPDKMRGTWITKDDAPAIVGYDMSSGHYPCSPPREARRPTPTSSTDRSGKIDDDAVIRPLRPSTTYCYRCSSSSSREFFLRTPPATVPINFVKCRACPAGLNGSCMACFDRWTWHIGMASIAMLLQVTLDRWDGQLPRRSTTRRRTTTCSSSPATSRTYADFVQQRWDSFARLVEPLASARPSMATESNHDVERLPLDPRRGAGALPGLQRAVAGACRTTSRRARAPPPPRRRRATTSTTPSTRRAARCTSAHAGLLGRPRREQRAAPPHRWLRRDLAVVDRRWTAFVVALVHAPWYSSNDAHRGPGRRRHARHHGAPSARRRGRRVRGALARVREVPAHRRREGRPLRACVRHSR